MTRYTYPGNMLDNCTDADLDSFYPSHLSLGAGSTPVLIDWNAVPFVSFPAFAGHVEIYKTGIRVYDDEGNPATHPTGGGNSAPIEILFKITDDQGGVSVEVATDSLSLHGLVPGSDPVPPAVIAMYPAVGAVSYPIDGTITLTWSKALLVGTGSIEIRNKTNNTLIETLTLPAALSATYPPAPGKIYLQGDQTVIKPTADLPNGKDISIRPGANFVKNLTGVNSAAITGDSLYFTTVPVLGASIWGYEAGVDYGTSGNMFVDQASGNDANNGLTFATAKKTIAAAMAAWTANTGGKIKIGAGTYKEAVALKSGAVGNKLILEPYGAAAPVITAAEPMTTGWVACTIADQPLVGANWASMIKKTGIPINTFPQSDPMNANLYAGTTRMNIARKYRLGQNVSCWCRSYDFLTADTTTVVTVGTTKQITAYQHAALLAEFSAFQIGKSLLIAQAAPNLPAFRHVSVSGSDIVPSAPVDQDSNTSVGWHKNFALFNLLAAMEPGGWGYDWDGTASTCDLYAWLPAGKTAADLTYTARTNIFTTVGREQALRGLIMERMSGSGTTWEKVTTKIYTDFGCALAGGSSGVSRSNIEVDNCWIRRGWQNNMGPQSLAHCGGVTLSGVNGLVVRKTFFDDLQASEGITVTQSQNILAEWNKFDKVYREDFWPRASNKVVYAHNLHTGTQFGHSHNNGVAFYVTNEGLEWGNIWKNATFFGTWQDSLNIAFAFNVFDWVGSYNAIKDQSGGPSAGMTLTFGGMIFNNTLVYSAYREQSISQSINVMEGAGHPFDVMNNIYYGIVATGTTLRNNGSNINNRVGSDIAAAPGNKYEGINTTFKDRANRDFSIGPLSVVRTDVGQDISSQIAVLAAAFPFFTDFTDAYGLPINAATPKIGAMTNLDVNPMSAV